jgi:hypothetical protein
MPFGVDRPLPAAFEIAPIATPKKKHPWLRSYGPDNPPPSRKGHVNRATKDLKVGLLTAATNLGRVDSKGEDGLVGFLEYLGLYHPKVFGHLLGKLIPLTVGADINKTSVSEIRVIGVPSDCYIQSDGSFEPKPAVPADELPLLEARPVELVPPEPEPDLSAQVKEGLRQMNALLDELIREQR